MSNIDHVATAMAALRWSDSAAVESPLLLKFAIEAQVHATLALVEEQRTSRLLAILQSEEGLPSKYTEASIDYAKESNRTALLEQYLEHNRLVDELRKRLGLDS